MSNTKPNSKLVYCSRCRRYHVDPLAGENYTSFMLTTIAFGVAAFLAAVGFVVLILTLFLDLIITW